MADYNYIYKDYTYTNNGNDWKKASHDGYDYVQPDHVCRPVIIDAEGRKKPIIAYTPSHNSDAYITKTETTVTDYKYGPSTKVEQFKINGTDNDNWRRPSSPVNQYRPQKVEEFITQTQTEASRPTQPLFSSSWRTTHNPEGLNNGSDDYRNYNISNVTDWNRPSVTTIRDGRIDDYYPRNGTDWDRPIGSNSNDYYRRNDSLKDSWERPTQKGWTTPPNHLLSGATNDIGTALELLVKDASKPSSVLDTTTRPRSTFPGSTVAKSDAYADTIDSKEAARRYGNFNYSSRPYDTGLSYGETIDSKEAMKKYDGSIV